MVKIVGEAQENLVTEASQPQFWVRIKGWYQNLSKRQRYVFWSGVAVFFLTTVSLLAYGAYSYWRWNIALDGASSQHEYKSTKDVEVKLGEPKDFESPINGVFYTQTEGQIFDQRRPMAIMVNNHVDARPIQAGLPEADIIFEAVAEGGITRFLAVYHAKDSEKVGPVRSVRVYYLDWASEFHPWVAHWGGAATAGSPANAYDYMAKNGIANLDAMWLGECPTCPYWRDLDAGVSFEHTGFTSTQALYRESAKRWPEWAIKVPFDRWLFKDDSPESERPAAGSLSFNFWDLPDYAVEWTFDPRSNDYLRSQGGKPHLDSATGQPLRAKDVVVQFTMERSANDGTAHLLYQTIGSGEAKVFLDGRVIDATWEKLERTSRTRYYDAATGEEIKFNRGQIWVEIVPAGNEISYTGGGE